MPTVWDINIAAQSRSRQGWPLRALCRTPWGQPFPHVCAHALGPNVAFRTRSRRSTTKGFALDPCAILTQARPPRPGLPSAVTARRERDVAFASHPCPCGLWLSTTHERAFPRPSFPDLFLLLLAVPPSRSTSASFPLPCSGLVPLPTCHVAMDRERPCSVSEHALEPHRVPSLLIPLGPCLAAPHLVFPRVSVCKNSVHHCTSKLIL